MATQMQFKVYLERNRVADRTFREKKQQQNLSFPTLFLMSTLTWITEKKLERVIKNKGHEFRFFGRKT